MIDDRAVSSTLSYILSLTIATLLVVSLLVAGFGFVDDSRETVIRNELSVIGEQVASDLERVDRLVAAGDGVSTAEIAQEFPRTVSGSTYDVRIESGSDRPVELSSVDPNVTVSVTLSTETPLGDSFAGGGPITARFDAGGNELVIDDA